MIFKNKKNNQLDLSSFQISSDNVYYLKEIKKFEYSDGDVEENYIFNVIRNAKNLSYNSSELDSKIKDWPSEYHLTSKRSNLVKSLRFQKPLHILEIGSGMGAITRYFGELGNTVVAVEGSYRRAKITRERCRDLNNVYVICSNILDLNFNFQFDMITLVGVLEYTPKFIGGTNPFDTLFKIIDKLLLKEGLLLIAIENRLGLKYFSGASEDHTGGHFDGICDRYEKNSVYTFGYFELKSLLQKYGFKDIEFWFPFPDYKVPDFVIPEKSLYSNIDKLHKLLSNVSSRDYSNRHLNLFPENIAWKTIINNRLVQDLSNSFLVLASKGKLGKWLSESSFDFWDEV